jgi:hypothetical protein
LHRIGSQCRRYPWKRAYSISSSGSSSRASE